MSKKKSELVRIPPYEFGPGCEIDIKNNRMIGASGTVYENCEVDFNSVKKWIDDYIKKRTN